MNRYLLFLGHSPARRAAFESEIARRPETKNYVPVFLNPVNHLGQYRAFIEEHSNEGPLWITLIGPDQAAEEFAKNFYSYYAVNPPRAAVLIFSTPHAQASVAELNLLTCPYLLIHVEKDAEISQAILHHQMRYGDPTQEERLLPTEDQKIAHEILEWLERVPELGHAKEGIHARGFRVRPLRDFPTQSEVLLKFPRDP